MRRKLIRARRITPDDRTANRQLNHAGFADEIRTPPGVWNAATAFATAFLCLCIAGCVSSPSHVSEKQAIANSIAFDKGEIRLNCIWACVAAAANARSEQYSLFDGGFWGPLATKTAEIGYDEDLQYFYLGRAAEGLGHLEAAKTYYRLALQASVTCGRRGPYNRFGVNACPEFNFPSTVEARLEVINRTETEAAQKAAQAMAPPTSDAPRGATPPSPSALPPSKANLPPPQSKAIKQTGSGFIVSRDGVVVTNHHVIDNCSEVSVRIDGVSYPAMLTADDARIDLALLQINPQGSIDFLRLRTTQIALGETITAIGFPLMGLIGKDETISTGIVSGLAGVGNNSSIYQISAPIQPGNSGGPVLDEAGNVIGVVVATLNAIETAKITGSIPQNVNFSIRLEVLKLFLDANQVRYVTTAGDSRSRPLRQIVAATRDAIGLVICR